MRTQKKEKLIRRELSFNANTKIVLVFCKQQSGGKTARWLEEIVHNSEVENLSPFNTKQTI